MAETSNPMLPISRIMACRVFVEKLVKRAVRTAEMKISGASIEGIRTLRIMISLHSANDFSTILRLYGIEESAHPLSKQETA